MTFLSQLCLEETTVNWHVTGDRDIFHSIRTVWSVPRVVPFFSTEETKVTGKRFAIATCCDCVFGRKFVGASRCLLLRSARSFPRVFNAVFPFSFLYAVLVQRCCERKPSSPE